MTTPRTHGAFFDRKCDVLAQLLVEHAHAPKRVLVVGCGRGTDAAKLARDLQCEVVGIDIDSEFDPQAAKVVTLHHADATQLPFPDRSFDMVYSYHVLEHIPNYRQALAEMRRILTPSGGFCIGTPNRQRIVGYIGSTNQTLRRKIRFNINDWKRRLKGQFRNELGAHAGFSERELSADLTQAFGGCRNVSLLYYLRVYPKYARWINFLHRIGLARFLFPSVYFVGSMQIRNE